MGGRGSSGGGSSGGGGIPPEYGKKRIKYAEYANGGYSPSEKISGSYDKDTKTVEVRTYPRIEKAAEMMPQSYINEFAAAYGDAKSSANRRKAVFATYYDVVDAVKKGQKVPSNALKWEKDLYKYVKKIVKRYGRG